MKIGRVYKIVVGQGNDVYIGSTFNQLKYRFRQHKGNYKRWKDGKKRKTTCYDMFDKYGVKNCKMILIKEYECLNRNHLLNYEQLWISKLNCINERSSAGYIIRNSKKTFYKLYDQIYYENNKERKNRKMTCECGSVFVKRNLSRHQKSKKHIRYVELQQ